MKFCLLCEGIAETERTRCSTCGTLLVLSDEVLFPRRAGEEHAMNPWVGTLLDGKYRIQAVLGRGGMGTVFRATHEVAQAPVALKLLHPRLAQSRAYREVFLAEARKASSIRHEGIARVQDVGETPEGVVYIAMELVEGATLHDLLQRGGPLPWPRAVALVRQIAEGLAAAHAAQVVHQDLASRNVMVEARAGRERVKILDFGISRAVGDRGRSQQEVQADGWANPPYSAPEQLSGEPIDARSDLYSLGVLLYEMLTGRPPHEATSREELIRRVLHEAPAPLTTPTPMPGWLQRLVQRLLQRVPEARPQSATEVLRELDRRTHQQVSKIVATGMLLLAGVLAAAAWSGPRLARLVLLPGTPLRLGIPDQLQVLPGAALAQLRLEATGLAPADLRVELAAAGGHGTELLDPEAQASGRVMVLSAQQSGWRRVLERLRSSTTAMDLVLRTRDGLRLDAARILIDDVPPQVEFAVRPEGAPAGLLARASLASYRVVDDRSEPQVQLVLRPEAGDEQVFALSWSERAGALHEWLSGVGELGPGTLVLRARDGAGNRAESAPVAFAALDFLVPHITSVRGPGANPLLLTVKNNQVRLDLQLDREEAGLSLGFARDAAAEETIPARRITTRGANLDVLLPVGEVASDHIEERGYRFWVVDRAGNRSSDHHQNLRLRTAAIQASLLASRDAPVRVLEGGEILSPVRDLRLAYRCNEVYRPLRAQLMRAGAPVPAAVELEGAAAGQGQLRVRLPTEAGECELRIEHAWEEDQNEPAPQFQATLVHLPEAPRIVVPAVAAGSDTVFLRALRDANVVVLEGPVEEVFAYRLGPGFVVHCGSLRGARMVLCAEQGQQWLTTELALGGGAQVLQQTQLTGAPGVNRVALRLVDGLGRPAVAVDTAGHTQPEVQVPGGAAALVLRVRHEPRGPEPVEAAVPVEFQERSTLTLEDPVAWDPAQSELIQLLAGSGEPLRPVRIQPVGGGCRLVFNLPFAWIARLRNWEHLSRAEFLERADRPEVSTVAVHTPAGVWSVPLHFRPIRSNLQQVTLGDLGAGTPGASDPVLAAVRFVPILGTAGQDIRVGLPPEVRVAGAITAVRELRVRDVPDCYLQDREVTRTLYDRLLRDLPADPDAPVPGSAPLLVHVRDPLGVRRLTRAGMTPSLEAFAPGAAWPQVVAAGPERPVTGVQFFQAYTFARWLGLRVLGDPDRFRLPCAVELELAALRQPELPPGPRWNGCHPHAGLDLDGLRAFTVAVGRPGRGLDPARWPLDVAQQVALGDYADTGLGRVHGLDFGVREWVYDFAQPYKREEGGDVLWMILQLHGSHLQQLDAYARDPRFADNEPGLAKANLWSGELRGCAWGESSITGLTPEQILAEVPGAAPAGVFSAAVPGVVRATHAARDGRGVFRSETDPMVLVAGFRIAGGGAFVRTVRER